MSDTLNHAREPIESAKPRPATHIVYTPAWQSVWDDDTVELTAGKFRAWLAVGDAWPDDSGGFIFDIHSQPINHEQTATSFFYCIPIGQPRPQPLTITRDEFLEQQFAAHDHE
jgi:hypothetical protein